jgi:hypothetical protein
MPVSAREKLYAAVMRGGPHSPDRSEQASACIDAFAHELAEEIRNSESLRDFTDDHMGDCNAAADLIDPEVS